MIRIAVIDGQGAAIGSTIIKEIRRVHGGSVEIWALGTNTIAVTKMLKAGANRGASGESSICHCVHQVDVIVGAISVLICDSMMGEFTPAMALAVGSSQAPKVLLPITQEAVTIVNTFTEPLPHLVEKLVANHLGPIVERNKSFRSS